MKGCKYTVLGTSVLVVDEVASPLTCEQDRVPLAQRLADPDYGVGCAIVGFLRRSDLSILANGEGPVPFDLAEQLAQLLQEQTITEAFVVRAFLPSGHELSLSAISLCAVTDYLYQGYSRREAWFVGGIPISSPSLHYVYRDIDSPLYNVAIGHPDNLPERFISPSYNTLASPISGDSSIQVLDPIITLPNGTQPLTLYAVYTGEPQLVCFVNKQNPTRKHGHLLSDIFERPTAVQEALFKQIVAHLNGCPEMLPMLINPELDLTPPAVIFNPEDRVNIVFARLNDDGTIDARFYRRGTCREVRLSGTGAVAAAVVAHHLGLLPRPRAEVRGWLNIAEGRHEAVIVQRSGEAWWLEAPVEPIWSGELE